MDFLHPKKWSLRYFFRENSTGIYGTILFHLMVLIMLMGSKIYSYSTNELSVLMDDSAEEAMLAKERKERTRETLSRELDVAITAAAQPVRNVAADVSTPLNQPLRDDRHTGSATTDLYEEARQIQAKLDASRQEIRQQQGEIATPATSNTPSAESYKGPTVISYDLGGRKALSLPVPVYQCQGGGDVTVQIEVNPQGHVTAVSIQVATSADNECLRDAAKRAAFRSRFAVDAKASSKQKGTIAYRFIAQ